MAREETTITQNGKNFIRRICEKEGNKLLSGNNGILPYSDGGNGQAINQTWTVNAEYLGNPLTINNIANALISWFEEAGDLYELDPNILAAQAYIESGYKLWWYDGANKKNTKSGINGFSMSMVYSIIVDNFSTVRPEISVFEIATIIENLEAGVSSTSYQPTSGNENTKLISRRNRSILHQNIINNPKIMIKAQARYMRYLSDNCDKLASTSLFCYNRDDAYMASTYSRAIQKLKKARGVKNDSDPYLKEGLDYVLKVFGVLGDKSNNLQVFKSNQYKPSGYYFGYDNLFKFNGNNDLISYPNTNFDPFEANKVESEEYNIDQALLDDLTIARDKRYKFIYFPEDQYIKTKTEKIQIVLHHTVSGGKDEDVGGDVRWWREKGERVATAFIISRGGQIFQLFNTDFWAYHLGLTGEFITSQGTTKSNKYLNERTIGIEIDSWGGLIQGTTPDGVSGWFPTIMDSDGDLQSFEPRKGSQPVQNVQFYNSNNGYPKGFRGFKGFEKYTDAQIKAVRDLILSLQLKFDGIDLSYNEDVWDLQNKATGCWGVSKNALNGKRGVWTHVSYRDDKSDCHPQPELIEMLKNLE